MATLRPTYTKVETMPRQIGDFNPYQREHDMRRAAQGKRVTPLPASFDVKEMILPTAVAAIRKAFLLSKTSKNNWKTGQREGKVDIRQAVRARPMRGLNVFRSKKDHSATKVRTYVLIDDSGSMGSPDAKIPNPNNPRAKVKVMRYTAAALFGATVATALGSIPTVTLDVFYHAASGGRLFLKWRWHKGTPITVFNKSAEGGTVAGGSNADGHAVHALTNRLLKELRRGEKGILLVVSDGLPATSPGGNAGQALVDAVAFARAKGITVIGVAIDGSDQHWYYGEDTLPFTGDWTAVGTDLARIVGRAMADH